MPIRLHMGYRCGRLYSLAIAMCFVDELGSGLQPPAAFEAAREKWPLEFAAALQGFRHGDFVDVFQVAADRQAERQARDADTERLDQA